MLFELSLLNAKLPESNSRCGRHVQRIYTVRHGDTNHIVGSAIASCERPSPSVPITIANRGSVFKTGLSMEMELSVSAMAAVRKPNSPSVSRGPSIHVHGTRKTVPIETRTARRFRGSQELRVNSTASMPRAAAERKMAPILVVSTTRR